MWLVTFRRPVRWDGTPFKSLRRTGVFSARDREHAIHQATEGYETYELIECHEVR